MSEVSDETDKSVSN